MEKPILCYEHCENSRTFCFRVPDFCELCQKSTSNTPFRTPPFQMPSPFKPSSDHPCSLVIKPTQGDFLTHYDKNSNLHIGITNSSGHVYEYDERGLTYNNSHSWTRCLGIPMLKNGHEFWDDMLQDSVHSNSWTRNK